MVPGPLDGRFEALRLEWLEQVIERVGFEGANRMFVEGGGDNDQRQALTWKFLEQVKAVHFGHLHVQEEQIGAVTLDGAERFGAAGAFSDKLQARYFLSQQPNALTRQRFVIDN